MMPPLNLQHAPFSIHRSSKNLTEFSHVRGGVFRFMISSKMANPQREHGHVEIANEIMEALARVNLPSTEWKILFFVIRKTWGWQKKVDKIALSQFKKGCLISTNAQLCRSLSNLVARRLLLKGENGYSFNKNYEEWVVALQRSSRRANLVVARGLTSSSPPANEVVAQGLHTKETLSKNTNTKETSSKEIIMRDENSSRQKKEKKIVDGEVWRGKDFQFDNFLDRCKSKNVKAAISPLRFFKLEEEFRTRLNFGKEIANCIDWLFDKNLKVINAQRIRNWFKKTIQFAKDNEIKKRQEYQDKRDQPQKAKPIKMTPLWTPPV